MEDNTKNWDRFTNGQSYNEQLDPPTNNRYETNWNMFLGNQWPNADLKDLPKPVFNFIKRIITFFVSSLTSTNIRVKWDALVVRNKKADVEPELDENGIELDVEIEPEIDVDKEAAEILNSQFEQFRENNKFDTKVREILFDGAVTGDMCFRLFFDKDAKPYGGKLNEDVKGEIKLEIIDGNRVYFGNPNTRFKEIQPFIQIEAREIVADLKKEYKAKATQIQADSPTEASDIYDGHIELNGKDTEKVTVLYTYERRENGNIWLSKDTQNFNFFDVDMEITQYPVAWGNWQTQKNQYHGGDVVSEVISNQIFINRAFALAMWQIIKLAFSTKLYNKDRMAAPTDMVGGAIGIEGLAPGERLTDNITTIGGSDMSNQVVPLIDSTIAYTKEVMGIADASLGSTNPEQASGTAIIAVQKQIEVPLGTPKAALYGLTEDVANIFCEMASVYYGLRPVIKDGEDGKEVTMYDFDGIQDALVKNNIDVGASSYYSELASKLNVDTLFAADKLSALEYFERLTDDDITDRQGLIESRKKQEEGQSTEEFQRLKNVLQSLPAEEQQRIMKMDEEQQLSILREMEKTINLQQQGGVQ